MTKTKRALLMSVLSLLLCFSMLIGSTFAWFTDSVTSNNNIIKSGNLDVVLEYKTNWDDAWAPVEQDTKIFKEGALYEPGYTEVVYLRVSNAGSLALKYQMKVDILSETTSTNVAGEEFKLSDYLQIGTYVQNEYSSGFNYADLLMPTMFGTREAALTNVTTEKLSEAESVVCSDATIVPGTETAQVAVLVLNMPETVGNEANHKSDVAAPQINLGVTLLATQFTHEDDSFDNQYDKDAVYPVANVQEFQTAIDEAKDGDIIVFTNDFAGDVTVPQKADTKITIDGSNKKFSGTLLIDGKSATQTTAGVTIKNVNFVAATTDACIDLGEDGNNNTRYTCNVTVEDCTFAAPGAVGIKSYTGGDKNLVIRNCTATAEAHSLAQLKGIEGVLIENCTVNSIRGINLNNSLDVTIQNCTINVQKYAVRFGESANSTVENYAITDCTISSQNVDGDAAIVLRAGATNANLTITNTTITAGVQMSGHADANVVIK